MSTPERDLLRTLGDLFERADSSSALDDIFAALRRGQVGATPTCRFCSAPARTVAGMASATCGSLACSEALEALRPVVRTPEWEALAGPQRPYEVWALAYDGTSYSAVAGTEAFDRVMAEQGELPDKS